MRSSSFYSGALFSSVEAAIVVAVACGNPEIILPPEQQPSQDAGTDSVPEADSSLLDIPNQEADTKDEAFVIVPADKVIDPVQPGDTFQFQAISVKTQEPIEAFLTVKMVAGTTTRKGCSQPVERLGGKLEIGAQTAGHQATTS